jgi:hypothetical protein
VLPFDPLLGGMVAGEPEPGLVEADLFHLDPLVAVEAGQIRDECFDDEDPALGQVRGDVLKAADLRLLVCRAKSVLKTMYTSVYRPSTGTSAKSPMVTGIRSPPRFERSRATIASEASMPCTSIPRSARGSAMRPVPTASTGPEPVLGEEGDGTFRIKGENLWPLVVDIGKAVAVSRRSVLLDGRDTTSGRISIPGLAQLSPPPPFRR